MNATLGHITGAASPLLVQLENMTDRHIGMYVSVVGLVCVCVSVMRGERTLGGIPHSVGR